MSHRCPFHSYKYRLLQVIFSLLNFARNTARHDTFVRLWLRSSPNHKKIVFNGVLRAVFVVLSYIEGNKSSAYMQGWFGDGILIEVFENAIEGLRYSIFCVSLESYKLLSFTEKQLKRIVVVFIF